ncbi:sensor histidine kinase [Dankookia sp. GCM10030260]|uniref:sensor histidine kinase n=1 Tax=Dankookia sp. GCM10030260 TaxID=3273390 RepID=UPI0036138A46
MRNEVSFADLRQPTEAAEPALDAGPPTGAAPPAPRRAAPRRKRAALVRPVPPDIGRPVPCPLAVLRLGDQSTECLLRHRADLLDLVPATGVALLLDGQPARAGRAPGDATILALAAWLEERSEAGIMAFDMLPAAAPSAGRLLAIALPRRPHDWILWLRAAEAPPWNAADLAAAGNLRGAWLEASLRRAESEAAGHRTAQSHQAFVMAELDHRLKNILANIQALLRHSRRRARDTDAFVHDFEARLHAMARAHDLLHASRWEGARLRPLVAEELGPHADGQARGRIAARGPNLVLRPRAAMSLSLALHELATNAAKHGALSVPDGRVGLRWHRTPAGLVMRWEEHGGPPAPTPSRRGFGLTVIERSLAYELGGSGSLEFTPLGLRCSIRIPADQLGEPG